MPVRDVRTPRTPPGGDRRSLAVCGLTVGAVGFNCPGGADDRLGVDLVVLVELEGVAGLAVQAPEGHVIGMLCEPLPGS